MFLVKAAWKKGRKVGGSYSCNSCLPIAMNFNFQFKKSLAILPASYSTYSSLCAK